MWFQGQLITQCLRYMKMYHSLYVVNMVCALRVRAGLSAFHVRCPTNATHNDSPASVKTYDFIQIVSFRGHSQYLATCAKMTPWQRDCNMPSMRMGALTGTSVWEASEDTMAVTWRLTPAVTPLMHHSNPVLVGVVGPSDTTTSQGRNTTRFPPKLGSK